MLSTWLLWLAASVLVPKARACECGIEEDALLPRAWGEVGGWGVALNARPRVRVDICNGDAGTEPGLFAEGAEEPTDASVAIEESGSHVLVYTLMPYEDLQPDTVYQLGWHGEDGWEIAEPEWLLSGDWIDSEAPPQAGIVDVEAAGGSIGECGGGTTLDFGLTGSGDGGRLSWQVMVSGDDRFEDGEVVTFLGKDGYVGSGRCALTRLEGLQAGRRYALRAPAIDLAGNIGPWSEVVEVRACSCASMRAGGGVGLVLLGLLGLRRRRRCVHARRSQLGETARLPDF